MVTVVYNVYLPALMDGLRALEDSGDANLVDLEARHGYV